MEKMFHKCHLINSPVLYFSQYLIHFQLKSTEISNMKHLTCCEKAYIHGLNDAGMQVPEIAIRMGRSESAIYALFKRENDDSSEENKNPVGRPQEYTERDKRLAVRYAKKNRRASLSEIANAGYKKVGKGVVRRALYEAGLHKRVAIKKPYLRIEHVRSRRAFAEDCKGWTMEQWKKVIWTDEASFELRKPYTRITVWRTCDKAYKKECHSYHEPFTLRMHGNFMLFSMQHVLGKTLHTRSLQDQIRKSTQRH